MDALKIWQGSEASWMVGPGVENVILCRRGASIYRRLPAMPFPCSFDSGLGSLHSRSDAPSYKSRKRKVVPTSVPTFDHPSTVVQCCIQGLCRIIIPDAEQSVIKAGHARYATVMCGGYKQCNSSSSRDAHVQEAPPFGKQVASDRIGKGYGIVSWPQTAAFKTCRSSQTHCSVSFAVPCISFPGLSPSIDLLGREIAK